MFWNKTKNSKFSWLTFDLYWPKFINLVLPIHPRDLIYFETFCVHLFFTFHKLIINIYEFQRNLKKPHK